jgi:hypothetical protein
MAQWSRMQEVASSVDSASGFELQPNESGGLTLTLWGDLGLGWLGRLANALSRRGISIESVDAIRRADGSWFGALQLAIVLATIAPTELDYFSLCSEGRDDTIALREPRIERFQIERTAAGALELRLNGADEVGFLASVLDRCEFLGLFPERLKVTTQEGTINDVLWLRGVAGNAPSSEAERALRAQFARLMGVA